MLPWDGGDDGFKGLADDRDRCLQGVGVVFRSTPQGPGGIAQGGNHPVEFVGDAAKLRHLVEDGERRRVVVAGTNPLNTVSEPAETAQVGPDVDEQA